MAKNIEPKLKKIGDYIKLEEDAVFVIPEYQRAYSWNTDNCDKLWQDINDYIASDGKDRYFFGTIIINCQDDDTKYGLIDGQQRTTTFLLLMKALLLRINIAIGRNKTDEEAAGLLRGLQERRRALMGILYKAETEDISDIPDDEKDALLQKGVSILQNLSINEQYKTELDTILSATDYDEAERSVVKIKYRQKDNKYTNFFRNFKYFYEKIGELSDSELISMMTGIMAGSLTSTPAFSAAKASVATESLQDIVSVGYGIAYIFGVVGVVLFVQIVPKLVKANMDEERRKISIVSTGNEMIKTYDAKFQLDPFGFCAFAFVVVCGILLGAIKIPLTGSGLSGTCFSLTNTGGVLIAGLIFGHFGHIGPISFKIEKKILETFREFGLVLFLTGAGVSAGAKFIQYFKWVYFIYGVFITIVPMVIGFLFAKYVLKISLLNALGSITGGMTSTPALGTLIQTTGTDEVAAAYASTYPIALIVVVLCSQFLILIFS